MAIKKHFGRILTSCMGLILGFSLLALPALAGSATGAYGYYTVKDIQYKNYSYVSVDDDAVAVSTAETYDGSQVSIGYIAACARLYDDNDSLVSSTSYSYNQSKDNSHSAQCSYSAIKSGTSYYSKGATGAFNGDGYTYYTTFASPFQTAT